MYFFCVEIINFVANSQNFREKCFELPTREINFLYSMLLVKLYSIALYLNSSSNLKHDYHDF